MIVPQDSTVQCQSIDYFATCKRLSKLCLVYLKRRSIFMFWLMEWYPEVFSKQNHLYSHWSIQLSYQPLLIIQENFTSLTGYFIYYSYILCKKSPIHMNTYVHHFTILPEYLTLWENCSVSKNYNLQYNISRFFKQNLCTVWEHSEWEDHCVSKRVNFTQSSFFNEI